VVRPLGLFFWAPIWSLTAWCELREDFRSFRLDRIGALDVLPERFHDEPGRTIDDFFARVGHEDAP
jgi:predicted DNA-binding transcriptional regulator YafY